MKTFIEKLSVTKLVLLLLVLTLIVIECFRVFKWWDLDQLFTDVVIMVVSFYFWQKGIVYDNVDSLVDNNKEDGKAQNKRWENDECLNLCDVTI